MENLNIGPFWVGQKVVYITGRSMPKDSIHTIHRCVQFPCGCWFVDIKKFNGDDEYFEASSCDIHNNKIPYLGFHHWAATSFRPLQQSKFPLMTFSEVKIKEQEQVLSDN